MKYLLALFILPFVAHAQYIDGTGTFKTITDLKLQKGAPWASVTVLGKDSLNDRLAGTYYWNDTSNAVADNDNVIAVTGSAVGRWIRTNNKRIYYFRNINGLSVGNTKLFTTAPTTFGRFIIQAIRMVPRTVAGLPIISPIINVGWTSTAYNDAVAAFTVIGGITVNTNALVNLVSNQPTAPAATDIYIRVATAGTGYTAYIFDVYIEGIYEQ